MLVEDGPAATMKFSANPWRPRYASLAIQLARDSREEVEIRSWYWITEMAERT